MGGGLSGMSGSCLQQREPAYPYMFAEALHHPLSPASYSPRVPCSPATPHPGAQAYPTAPPPPATPTAQGTGDRNFNYSRTELHLSSNPFKPGSSTLKIDVSIMSGGTVFFFVLRSDIGWRIGARTDPESSAGHVQLLAEAAVISALPGTPAGTFRGRESSPLRQRRKRTAVDSLGREPDRIERDILRRRSLVSDRHVRTGQKRRIAFFQ